MESKLSLGKLSLTRRLTLFFTVVAAAVVLGLGGLFLVEIKQHFVEMDRMALQEKRHLIEEILNNAESMDDASLRLSEALNYHHDLYALVQSAQGETVFRSSASNLNVQSGDVLTIEGQSVFGVWRHQGTEFHTLSFGTAPAYSSLSEILCVRHNMSSRSMNATQNKNHRCGGPGGAAAILSRAARAAHPRAGHAGRARRYFSAVQEVGS